MKHIFPAAGLGTADYVLGAMFVTICFVLFFHADMWGVGWDSLNYLFGSPLEFYENCKRIRGGGHDMLGTPYPPPIYAIFALWLYPFEVFGLISGPESLPLYLSYWLKVLTTLAYIVSGWVFYRIALEYVAERQWAKYAAATWLTMPLALFSQFIFSQYDIFYVLPTLAGFLMFLRGGLSQASLLFGAAITFKYFPAFAFFPLLLLFEKRPVRIAFCCLIFLAPTLLIELLYGQSPAFIEGVKHHPAIARVFAISMDVGGLRIYFLFAAFGILCGLAYFTAATHNARAHVAAYLWLIASILPFLFILWHPQWVIAFAPPIVLTSLIHRKAADFMLLDFVGMFLFVAAVSLAFQNNVDAAMFRGQWLGLDFGNSYLMAGLFAWFGGNSVNVFLSGFWAYLALQIILKHGLLHQEPVAIEVNRVDYGVVRQRLYVGLLIFLLPASFAIYVDWRRDEAFTNNAVWGGNHGELLSARMFEQTFLANGSAITRVSLFLTTYARQNRGDIALEIFDAGGNRLVKTDKAVADFQDNAWHEFVFEPIPASKHARYKIRLTAAGAVPGSAITWWGSSGDSYHDGQAIVDGVPGTSDFAFRVGFTR